MVKNSLSEQEKDNVNKNKEFLRHYKTYLVKGCN